MKYCPNCGKQIPENANVCPYCGIRLLNMSQTHGQPTSHPITSTPSVQYHGHNKGHRFIMSAIIIVLLCLGGGYYYHNYHSHINNNSSKYSSRTVNFNRSLPSHHWQLKVDDYDGPVKFHRHEFVIQNDRFPIKIRKHSILVNGGSSNYYVLKLTSRNGNHYHMKITQIHVNGKTINIHDNHLTMDGHSGSFNSDNSITIGGRTFRDPGTNYVRDDWVFTEK